MITQALRETPTEAAILSKEKDQIRQFPPSPGVCPKIGVAGDVLF
jgi:hypothetical protein